MCSFSTRLHQATKQEKEMDEEKEELEPLDIKLTGPFSTSWHPRTDDICVYDAQWNIVECFFYPQEAQNFCDELNAEYEALKQASSE
jgi:hypothetical protein